MIILATLEPMFKPRCGKFSRRSRSLGAVAVVAVALALGGASRVVYADIYKYVDKEGRVFLTDKPPHKGYKRISVSRKKRPSSRINFKDMEQNRKKFSPTIASVARRERIPEALIHAVIVAESAYDPNAVSHAGAVGLMQLMPDTARRYGVRNRRDPRSNVSGGTRYLKDLLTMFDNNLALALAGYNAGENAVESYGRKIPPYRETQDYVKKVIRLYKDFKEKYNDKAPPELAAANTG